jgi:phosphocarrier protein HPr
MFQLDVTFTATTGLHARPASTFVTQAKTFTSSITVTSRGKTVDAKSLFKLLTLDLTCGTVLTVAAEGNDEQQAVETLVALLRELE